MADSKKYTADELTTLFLEAVWLSLKAYSEIDMACYKAKSEVNEMFNARIASYVANAESSANLS